MAEVPTTWRRCDQVAVVDRGDRVVLLRLTEPATARPQVLAGPAATVWHALAEPGTAPQVAARVAEAVGVAPAEVEQDVAGFLDQLAALGLVTGAAARDTGVA